MLSFIMKLKGFKNEHIADFGIILIYVIKIDELITPKISECIGDIFEKLHNLRAINELALLCETVFERYEITNLLTAK